MVELEELNNSDAKVRFRNSPNDESMPILATQISEIGIANDVRIKRFTVNLDDSDYINVKTSNRYADFKPVNVFLSILIDGPAKLYAYEGNQGDKFFYLKDGMDKPVQLIYKKFRVKQIYAPQENVEFRQQLRDHVSCPDDPFSKFSTLPYKRNELIEIFNSYNVCQGGTAVSYENKTRSKAAIAFSAYLGLYLILPTPDGNSTSKSDPGVSVGGEFEVLSAARKWGFFARLELERVNFELNKILSFPFSNTRQRDIYKFESTSVNFMVGPRYHFSRADKNHLFIDGAIGLNLPFGEIGDTRSFITTTEENPQDLKPYQPNASVYGMVGIGYTFNRKFSLAARYELPKILLVEKNITLSYARVGLSAAYTF